MTIAITGATGQLGRLVVNKLKSTIPADKIVALVRSSAKAADLGVTAREADYSKPETLAGALAGVEAVLLNTAIAHAKDPLRMAWAMRQATEAGRLSYLAGRIPKKLYATASSPTEGTIARA